MERCFSILALYFSQLPKNWLSNDGIISFLAVLRLRFPDVFDGLTVSKLSYEKLVEVTGIDKIERTNYTKFPKDWLLGMFKFLLLTDEEYKALDENADVRRYEQWLSQYNIDRTEVIPFFCLELVRFKMGDV
jgi:hypothetical protein